MHTYRRKMKTACNKKFDVYDFKPETEVSEFAIRAKSKLENPRSAIEKYAFLETDVVEDPSSLLSEAAGPSNLLLPISESSCTAASGKSISAEEVNYVPYLDIGASTQVENPPAGLLADPNDVFTVVKQHHQSSPELKTDISESEVNVTDISASPSNGKLKSTILDLSPALHDFDEAAGMDKNDNGRMSEKSLSSSGDAEDDGAVAGSSSDHCIDGWEVESEDITAIVFYPDHVLYRGNYYTDSLISFTSSFIELEGSEVDGDGKTFKCKWRIEDILHITSHWYERVEMAMVKIHVLAKDSKHAQIVECASGTELKFSVIDSSWYERLEAVVSLNIIYKALWTSMLESEDAVIGHRGGSFAKYLPNFDRPFEEVVYPKGDADAVSISKRDFDLLQPDTFVNDTIIDFYIKYLKNKIQPDEKRRLHFFNSFFFRKLADPDKDPLDASRGVIAYQRVKKWTRKVNLFEKDYVFIPVNYNYHWSLIVICHLGEVATYEDEGVKESEKVPCVLHLDSFRGSHTGLQGLVKSYLKEEWKARQDVASEDVASRFDDLRFISLELPQQQNSFDCGLFLLHYVELFLEQAPLHFNPFKISKSFSFLNVDWFPPAEASLKRVVIQKLICDLLENPHQEPCSTAGNDQQCRLSSLTTNSHKGTVVNLSLENCNPLMHHQSSHAHQEIEMPSSSLIQCADDPNIILKPSFQSEFNCAIEEKDVQQDNGIMLDDSALPFLSQDCRTQEPWQAPVTSDHKTANNNHARLLEISIYGCDDSIEIVNESSQLDSGIDQPRSPAPLDTLSGYVHQMVDGNLDYDPTCGDIIIPGPSFGFSDMQVTGSENSSGLESDVQHPTKKMRMTQQQKVSSLL